MKRNNNLGIDYDAERAADDARKKLTGLLRDLTNGRNVTAVQEEASEIVYEYNHATAECERPLVCSRRVDEAYRDLENKIGASFR